MSKSKLPTIVIKDRIYVPTSIVDAQHLKKIYTKRLYVDSSCKKCTYFADRYSYLCDGCEAFKGTYKLFKIKNLKGEEHIGLPIGDKKNFEKNTGILFSEVKIRDRRVLAPFDYKIKFIIPMRDYQEDVIADFLKKKYGLIEAPPRTGKTAILLYLSIALGQRTIILANQHEFLDQFNDHIHGNLKEEIPKCTNLPELEKKYGKKLYGFPKTDEDFKNFQIITCTYQQFISEARGKDRLRKLLPNIGTLGIDEVHTANSDEFSKVVSKFACRYKLGVSATMDRKDGKQFLVKALLGPVVARSTREAMTPTVHIHETGVVPKRKYAGGKASWVYAMQFLSKEKKRNKLIVKWAMHDLKNGHNIVIPVTFKKHVLELQRLINQEYGKPICGVFLGGGGKGNKERRKEILSQAKANKIRVIVGIRSLLQLGLNVPTWSAIYTAIPISNEPKYKQETSRVRTPMEGKRPPIVRLFVDKELGQSIGCAKSCIKHLKGFGYDFSQKPEQKALLYEVLNSGRRRASDDEELFADEFKTSKHLFDKPITGNTVKRF